MAVEELDPTKNPIAVESIEIEMEVEEKFVSFAELSFQNKT